MIIQLDRSAITDADMARIMAHGYALMNQGRAASVESAATDEGSAFVCMMAPNGLDVLYHVSRDRRGAFYALDGAGVPVAEGNALEVVLAALKG